MKADRPRRDEFVEASIARRLRYIPGIGSEATSQLADRSSDPALLRLEGMSTDLRPPAIAVAATHLAVDDPATNQYAPFRGQQDLREAVALHLERTVPFSYDPETEILSTLGGLNGMTDCLLALVNPGDEVVLTDPIYSGLVNRVHLVGGRPRYVKSRPSNAGWYTDPDEVASLIGSKTKAVLLSGTFMPTGALLRNEMVAALAGAIERYPCWLIYNAAMEYVRFDGTTPLHPAAHPALRDYTITLGSASKELRMVGWRVGWAVAPSGIVSAIHRAGLSNVACQVGIAQRAVAAALTHPDFQADIDRVVGVWRARAELVHTQLADYGCIPAEGGWSVLIDTARLGVSPAELAQRLLVGGSVASTPMTGWGPSGKRYVRLAYGYEPLERLSDLRDRFERALR